MTRESPFCKRDEIADSLTHLSRASWRDVGSSFRIFSGKNDGLTRDLREGVRGVFQENEADHDVLVLGGVQVVVELVGGKPELRLESER